MNINELAYLGTKGFQLQELNGLNLNNTNLAQHLKMINDRANNKQNFI